MQGIVFSSHINAYTLYEGSRRLGIDLSTTDINPNFLIPFRKTTNQDDWLFFTEEDSLQRALKGEEKGKFFPSQFPQNLLDNKWAFVEWLAKDDRLTPGLSQWSLFKEEKITYPCVCKAKHSWIESVKLPRGWICRSEEEVKKCIENIQEKGLNTNHFFLQEWLGDSQCRVISVCGFYDWEDDSRNLTAVVERIASYTNGLSCSAALETISDEWELIQRTFSILNGLKFTGPFELEYIVSGYRVVVLELNPRFWMQHSIFLGNGNGVIKRYLRMDSIVDRSQQSISRIVWVDGLHLLRSILFLQVNFPLMVVRKFLERNKSILIFPSLPKSISMAFRVFCRKIIPKLKKSLSNT